MLRSRFAIAVVVEPYGGRYSTGRRHTPVDAMATSAARNCATIFVVDSVVRSGCVLVCEHTEWPALCSATSTAGNCVTWVPTTKNDAATLLELSTDSKLAVTSDGPSSNVSAYVDGSAHP
jgi:hypothetical protein